MKKSESKLNKEQKKLVKLLLKLTMIYFEENYSIEEGEYKYTNTDLDCTSYTINKIKKLLGIR